MVKCDKVDYSKGLIYKLCCKNPEIKEIYVGSTTNLIKRKYYHKYDCNNVNSKAYNHYKYQFIRDNGGFKNWSMILIENYACENKRELEKRERYFMELLNSTLNSYTPFLTEEEKKEQKKEYDKEWIENNKQHYKDYQKEYYEKYKTEIKEYNKQHYKNNKETINENRKKEKYNCVCGSNLRLADKKRHLKSTKHLDYIRIYFNILRQNKTIIK